MGRKRRSLPKYGPAREGDEISNTPYAFRLAAAEDAWD